MEQDVKAIKRLLSGMFVITIFSAMFFAKDILLPIVLGILLSLTLSPLVRSLGRIGLPAPASSFLIVFGVAASVGLTLFFLSGTLSAWVDDVPRITNELKWKLEGINDSVQAVQEATDQVEEIANGTENDVQKVVLQQPGFMNAAVSNLASFGTSLIVGLILALFILSSGDLFYEKIVAAFPRLSDKKKALAIVYDIERRISHYLLAITLINLGLGCAVAIAMSIIGVPYAVAWGMAAFFLNYLPFVGGLVGTIGVAAYAIVSFDSLSYAILAPVTYQMLTTIEGQFLTPFLLGRRLQLNIVSVFLTVILWGWLWGIPGALMAVPILVLVKVICDHIDGLTTFGNFLSAR